jgi:hypothetical protein
MGALRWFGEIRQRMFALRLMPAKDTSERCGAEI